MTMSEHCSWMRVQLRGEHREEVGGRMSSSSFVSSPRFPSAVERHEHLPSLVFPAQGGVRVVAVFLDALLKLAAWVVSDRSEERAFFGHG